MGDVLPLAISPSSGNAVIKTVGRLQRDGLVVTKPYRAIFLTDEGRRIAIWSRQRHELVVKFLLAIGVSKEVAYADAEGIEHHVSAETLAAFERVVGEINGRRSASGH